MSIVCEVCGDIGCEQLLICCRECGDSATHQYCFDEVIYDGSLADWLCFECQQKSGEVICRGSLGVVSSERPSHAHSGSTPKPPSDNRVEPATDVGPWSKGKIESSMIKYASLNKISSSETNSRQKKHIQKKLDVRKMGDSTNIKGCNTTATGLRSCEKIGTEITKNNNSENQQFDDENSVCSLNSKQPIPLIVNSLGYKLGDKAVEGSDRKSKRTPKSLRALLKRLRKKKKNKVFGSKSKTYRPAAVNGNSVLDNGGANLSSKHTDRDNWASRTTSVGCKNMEVRSGKDAKKVAGALEDKHWAAASLGNEPKAHNDIQGNVMDCLTQEKEKEVMRFQLDHMASDELQHRSMASNVAQQSTLQDNGGPVKKRRRYIHASEDEDEDEEANKTEETSQTEDFRDSDARSVKKRRRYINANGDEDEEPIIDVMNVSSAENDVANCTLDDGANLESLTAVAGEHPLHSRIASDSDTEDQQYHIYSRPIDEPVWSGAFKLNDEVFGKLDAHLSSKACEKVWGLSRMLQPVVEVMKIPRWQAWPRRWTSTTPTDNCIGLFFFPRSSRPNEESDKLVNGIIDSDDALKVAVGAVELLIFPSTLLSEKNQLFQGKHYLWGVFKRRKDKSDRAILVGEQDAVACATEESTQEQHVLHQQDGMQCDSSGQETSVVNHVENEIMVEAQKAAMKIAKREDITLSGSKSPYSKPNSQEDGSKCSVDPRIDDDFHAPEEMNHHEESFSSPVLNASSVTKSITESSHGESHSGSEAPTTKLFGIVTARTPWARQLIEEMVSEGALVFSVPEQKAESCTGSNVGVGSGLNPDTDEHPQSFDFISTGHGVPDEASEACLELFPVQQEKIGWAPRVEATKEVDLELSLGACSRAPSVKL